MLVAALFFASALSKPIWELKEPRTYKIPMKDIITFDQLNGALKKTDLNAYVKNTKPHAPANDTCWHWNRPRGCPSNGFVKYEKINFVHATVGSAACNVVDGNKVGLVVGNVTMHIPKTKFTVQPQGIFTIACGGVVSGVIKGASAAVQAVVKLLAEGVPVLGEISAEPIDGVIVELQHALEGVCAIIEEILKGLLDLIQSDLEDITNKLVPALTKALLGDMVKEGIGAPSVFMLDAPEQ